VFTDIVLASRTEAKCKAIAAQLSRPIRTAQVDADNVPELVALLQQEKPELVINVALPYQDLPIMDACLEAGVDYLDTANYEPPDDRQVRVPLAVGLPGALLRRRDHGPAGQRLRSGRDQRLHRLPAQSTSSMRSTSSTSSTATPATTAALRDQLQPGNQHPRSDRRGRHWENGAWQETDPLSVKAAFDFPDGIGRRRSTCMYHEELESLVQAFSRSLRARASG
jgi:saccharopine dehydrogenase (NAD+, L-lysine-forming)